MRGAATPLRLVRDTNSGGSCRCRGLGTDDARLVCRPLLDVLRGRCPAGQRRIDASRRIGEVMPNQLDSDLPDV